MQFLISRFVIVTKLDILQGAMTFEVVSILVLVEEGSSCSWIRFGHDGGLVNKSWGTNETRSSCEEKRILKLGEMALLLYLA